MILVAFMALTFASIPAYFYRKKSTDFLGVSRKTSYRLLSQDQTEELEIGTDAVEMSEGVEIARPLQVT